MKAVALLAYVSLTFQDSAASLCNSFRLSCLCRKQILPEDLKKVHTRFVLGLYLPVYVQIQYLRKKSSTEKGKYPGHGIKGFVFQMHQGNSHFMLTTETTEEI